MSPLALPLLALALGAATPAAPPASASAAQRPSRSERPALPGRALDCAPYECWSFRSPAEAFRRVLASQPRVLGIGEYHEVEGDKKVASAIKRFTSSMLVELRGKAGDLIVETWVRAGQCGEVEKAATQQIEQETRRPESTENELEKMLLKAADLGIQPHILNVSCEEYEELLTSDGDLDAEKLLQLVTRLLRDKALDYFRKASAGDGRMVVVYGGALHNDMRPPESIRDFTFGPELAEATSGRYVEIDLIVPEYLLRDDEARKEPWFPAFQRHLSKSRTLLIELAPDSFLLFFPKSR